MISSAVVIPEEPQAEPERTIESNSLKRRQSTASLSSESNKRPRLDARSSSPSNQGAGSPQNGAQPELSATTTGGQAMSPPPIPDSRRRQMSSGFEQDKSRNRRLFGALLGTLSQSSKPAKPASGAASALTARNSRREEIENRQRERLKRESEEMAETVRRKKEELDRVRRKEQQRWDAEAMRIRHRNLRATARFLETKAEPKLYYKPWELRGFEEETIKRQLDDANETIRRELDEREAERASKTAEPTRHSPSPPASRNGDMEVDDASRPKTTEKEESSNDGLDGPATTWREGQERNEGEGTSAEDPGKSRDFNAVAEGEVDRPMSSGLDDHGGEELEQGQEDDVIY